MAVVSTLGSGQVRDLEGMPSDRVSMSDLAFHALREYVPGDDLRHVHWRSSARAGELLVRQYHDTRRNHATVVLDADPAAYRSDEEYELGVSVAASLIMCAAREEYDVSLVCGREQLTALPAGAVLDATCRVRARAPGCRVAGGQMASRDRPGAGDQPAASWSPGSGTDLDGRRARDRDGARRDPRRRAAGRARRDGRRCCASTATTPSPWGRSAELPGLMAAAS